MDGHFRGGANDSFRRGGGRSGSMRGRGSNNVMYRRVQVVSDEHSIKERSVDTTSADSSKRTDGVVLQDRRNKTQANTVVKDETLVPFHSSLRASLQSETSSNDANQVKNGRHVTHVRDDERRRGGNFVRTNRAPNTLEDTRDRSNSLQSQVADNHQSDDLQVRRMISLSSPQRLADQKQFDAKGSDNGNNGSRKLLVSSLAQSIKSREPQKVSGRNERRTSHSSSNTKREVEIISTKERDDPVHQQFESGLTARNDSFQLASSARHLPRKNSTDSIASQRSDYDKNHRWERKDRAGQWSGKRLARKNSSESISSQRSDYEKSYRWERKNKGRQNGSPTRSLSRKNSSESISSQVSDYDKRNRYEGRGRRGPSPSPSRGNLSRKNSVESISSQRSDYDRGRQWEQRNSYNGEPKYDERRYSNSKPRFARSTSENFHPDSRTRRSVSDATSGPPPVPYKSPVTTKSSQDVRVHQSERIDKISPSIQHIQGSARFVQNVRVMEATETAPPPLKSSLAAAITSDIRPEKTPGILVVGPLKDTEHDTKEIQTANDSELIKSFRSTLSESINHQQNSHTGSKATENADDDAERKRLATEKLKERFETRKLERGSSLAEILKSTSSNGDTQTQEMKPSPSVVPSNEKEMRVKEFYSRLDKDSAQREAARRAVPFHSSLQASIASKPTRAIPTRVQKIQYSLEELRSLMSQAIPKPNDLPDMTIVEVIQVRVPTRSISKHGQYAGSKALNSRKRDRFGAAGIGQHPQKPVGGRGRKDKRQGLRGRGGQQPPPPPLYDGPIEPLTLSENRWIPKKDKSGLDSTLSHVKSVLNKLTREKFAKLTKELCDIEMKNLEMLRSIVSIIMDKALEEPNFADVYADLCKELNTRTSRKSWPFLKTVEDAVTRGTFYWTAVREDTFPPFAGPFKSVSDSLRDALNPESSAVSFCDYALLSSVNFFRHPDHLVAVGESKDGDYYYMKRAISDLSEDEPIVGTFQSAESAYQAALTQTTFKRLLVTRCQVEFEKTNKRGGASKETEDKEAGELTLREREINAIRAKRLMLGNIRFIGELFKVDMIKQNVVQGCIFHLLGLELIVGAGDQDFTAQAVRFPDEEDMEALCKMLATTGKKFDQPATKTIMNIIILRLVELSEDKQLNSRSRFLTKDVLEMRDHMWEPRRKELQQKTLEEVRKEAQKLQQQGKNAQHDDLAHRRRKTQISSAQLARQSSNLLLVRKDTGDTRTEAQTEESSPASEDSQDPQKFASRIKNIIQEYISILDLEEAATCVRELPAGACHVEFADRAINLALDGKANEREQAVCLLVGLYQCGALDATSIQTAITNVMEFLEDIRIDIPLVHQYSALIFGRLIAVGCFGLSWMITEALGHLIECRLTSMVFPEVLSVLEMETNERTVMRMLADEEISPISVLPNAMKSSEIDVKAYLRENGIEEFFGGNEDDDNDDDDDELDPDVAGKMRNTLEEYLSVKDFGEVVLCVKEFEATTTNAWKHFIYLSMMITLDGKKTDRIEVSDLLVELFAGELIGNEDAEAAVESVLGEYEDLCMDIPKIAESLSELLAPLLYKAYISVSWLHNACSRLLPNRDRTNLFVALFSELEARFGEESVVSWWKMQADASTIWEQLNDIEKLSKWRGLLSEISA